jgi:diadenosine tetraphosphate (Ap4A) HIT family hydrolase
MDRCFTCELTSRRDAGTAPLWECIYRTQYWDVAHCYNTALSGWLVLVARRHIAAIDEMTEAEAIEFGILMRQVSAILKQLTGCIKTYIIQFAEASGHCHVHFHVVPRMDDLPEDHRGPNIFKYLGVADNERVSETAMNEFASEVQGLLRESELARQNPQTG